MKKETFYITTPIYYPSGNWHIGTCYTTVVCDSLARFNRMLNKEVFYLTGTDEHGQKVEGKARELGVTPKEFVDPIVEDLKKIWEILDISYDRFIRTTDDYHVAAVQKIFKKLYDNGDIYKSTYEGWYCTPCESFWTDTQLVDGKCPDCGREVHKETEESYFFRLSKYADKILKLYEDNPEFLQPKSRMNEMINNFIRPGLQDLCVSRTSIKWGVPVDFDEKHTVYVWIDALSNYITALGYASEDDSLYKKFWPCDIHMTGKEIIRFHAIIWPAILMSLGEEVPKKVYGHGWLLIGGDKLSKSKEGKIATELTDPKDFVARYGSDPLRYYLLREIPFGSDGAYTNEAFLNRLNSDLANDLGNLVSRTTAMINQYFGGALPKQGDLEDVDKDLISVAEGMLGKVKAAMESLNVPDALVEIFRLIGRANKYIDETMPWILAKDPDKKERLGTVMYNLAESIRFAATVLKCYLTKAPAKILALFGIDEKSVKDFSSLDKFGWLKEGTIVEKSQPIFPRIDLKKELAAIDEMMIARHKEKEKSANKPENNKKQPTGLTEKCEPIGIEDFFKTELRVAKVLECEKVEKSKKLLKFKLSLGYEERTVVSGIAQFYTPEELIGRNVIVVANLKPAVLAGIESNGMILCADGGDSVILINPPENAPVGSRVR